MAKIVNTNADDRSRVERDSRAQNQMGGNTSGTTSVNVGRQGAQQSSKNSLMESVRSAVNSLLGGRQQSQSGKISSGMTKSDISSAPRIASSSSQRSSQTAAQPSSIQPELQAESPIVSSSPVDSDEYSSVQTASDMRASTMPYGMSAPDAAVVSGLAPSMAVSEGGASSDAAVAESAANSRSADLKIVDTDNGRVAVDVRTGEIIDQVPAAPSYAARRTASSAAVPMAESEMAAAIRDAEPQAAASAPAGAATRINPLSAAAVAARSASSADAESDALETMMREEAAERELGGDTVNFAIPVDQAPAPIVDDIWRFSALPDDIAKISDPDERRRKAKKYLEDRDSDSYASVAGRRSDTLDDYGRAKSGISFDDIGSDENLFMRTMRGMQQAMVKRFNNPSSLHIEGEYIEMHTEAIDGEKITYARRTYNDRVLTAIGIIRRMYNCSTRNVMQLVMLRAGLGIDSHGTIANVDPNEFHLTEDQFVELCRDIQLSQERNGHPLGSVDGIPGGSGVRDDTGRYVVVAKTRCFPLGYMPKSLIADLRRDWNSPLHQYSTDQIQESIKREWIDRTYPTLCANTGGNLMFQARAIENMMRAMMSIDGVDPGSLDIPEIVERKTLMELRAEQASIDDPDIKLANEVKHRNLEQAMSRMVHRFRKSGIRGADGSIEPASAMQRAENALRRISSLERAAKAANIGVMISSVPENLVANRMQSVALMLSDGVFSIVNHDIAETHSFTAELERMSISDAAVEARSVAESLYRIGGHDAIDAFLGEVGDDGRARNRLTKPDLNRFMQELGIIGSGASVSDRVRDMFGIKPGQEPGFLSNASQMLDNMMLGSGMFRKSESKMFVRMSMAELARSAAHGRESYTSAQVEDWYNRDGGEALIRSLLQTDAGREAFMTQGITSLGRKSPVEHGMRLIMAKNGLTEFAVRTFFDRFPEYGVNKVLQMVPFSNTISYLGAYSIKGVGDIFAEAGMSSGSAMQRSLDYQAGTRTSFAEGLRKNILYDTVMGCEKLLIAGLYCGIITMLGGVQPPDDKDKRYTWSEWKIGDGDDAVPIKWAWWMDDLSGVGLPLGMAWAICQQYGWSSEAKDIASKVFVNAVANFNSGTAVFDAIDLINNFDEEIDAALGMDVKSYDPDFDEWLMTIIEQGLWDLVGDLTPTFVSQLVPWSKDWIFRGDADAHTASRVYDVGEGSKYTMEEAQEGYHTRQTGSYSDYMRRRSAQTNVLQAIVYDLLKDDDTTGYKYTEQPLDTMTDPYVYAMYSRFFLDLDPATSDLPLDQDDRQVELFERAREVCQYIDDNYQNATQARLAGFALNYDARVNCINYCWHMIDLAHDNMDDRLSSGYLSDSEYDAVIDEYYETRDHYQNLIYNYFQNDEIPWSMPRYVRQESDRETIYIDDQGNPMTWLDTLGPDAQAHQQSYWYGNVPSLLPFTSPRTSGRGYNYETIPYWVVLDADGNPVNDVGAAYDEAANLQAGPGRNSGKNIQELMWGGQGTNIGPESDEVLNIDREGVPTIGDRPWRLMEETFPESLRDLDADTVSNLLGIPASLPSDNNDGDDSDSGSDGNRGYNYPSYGGYSYYPSYSYSGGGGYDYNPRIYSNSSSVYSSRPSGMSTRSPYSPQRTYLRPGYYTAGSRKSYSRQQ